MAKRRVHNTQAQLLGADEPKGKHGRHSAAPASEQPPRRRTGLIVGIVLALAFLVGGVTALFVLDPPIYFVTINGSRQLVPKDTTIERVIVDGKVAPVPGDLIAVDGSIARIGGGERFSATLDGIAITDSATALKRDSVLEIGDGQDIDETFSEGEEAMPAGVKTFDESPSAYYEGALHVYTHGEEGWQSYRLGDVSGIKVATTVEEPIPSTYQALNATTTDKVIALTFDDGPWEVATAKILDVLEANHAHATFFTIGSQVTELPEVVRRAHALGCQVATHTWDHASGSGGSTNLAAMTPKEQVAEVLDGYDAIEEATGETPSRVMRAPGGNFYGELVRNLEPYVDVEVGWNVDTHDWDMPGADAIYKQIMAAQPGQVVLLHDGGGDRSQTVEAVAKAVPELMKKGYRLVTIDELLQYVS